MRSFVVLTVLGVAACGGNSAGGAIGSAATSDGGGSNDTCVATLEGCSVPPASQGSSSIHFAEISAETTAVGKQCSPGVHWANAPTAQTSDQLTTGQSRPRDTLVDGEQGRHFACAVQAAGDKFVVSAAIDAPAFDKDNKPLQIPMRIQLATTIGKDEAGATGSLLVADSETGGATYQSTACFFSVKANAAAQQSHLAIDKGKAWGNVTCPSLDDPKDPSSSCAVDVGYFILENCDQ